MLNNSSWSLTLYFHCLSVIVEVLSEIMEMILHLL